MSAKICLIRHSKRYGRLYHIYFPPMYITLVKPCIDWVILNSKNPWIFNSNNYFTTPTNTTNFEFFNAVRKFPQQWSIISKFVIQKSKSWKQALMVPRDNLPINIHVRTISTKTQIWHQIENEQPQGQESSRSFLWVWKDSKYLHYKPNL